MEARQERKGDQNRGRVGKTQKRGEGKQQRGREERDTCAVALATLFWICFCLFVCFFPPSVFLALKLRRIQQMTSLFLLFSEIYIKWIILFRIFYTLYFHF